MPRYAGAMAAPPLNEPLTTIEELAVWIRRPITEDEEPFAYKVIEGTAVVVREAGSVWWTASTAETLPEGQVRVPYRAKLLADLKAKNFFEHPTGAVSETVGPLSERYLDEVVQQIQLSDAEKLLLAQLADDGGPAAEPRVVQGIWALSAHRGELETHGGRGPRVIHVPYWRHGSKMIPYYTEGELGAPLS